MKTKILFLTLISLLWGSKLACASDAARRHIRKAASIEFKEHDDSSFSLHGPVALSLERLAVPPVFAGVSGSAGSDDGTAAGLDSIVVLSDDEGAGSPKTTNLRPAVLLIETIRMFQLELAKSNKDAMKFSDNESDGSSGSDRSPAGSAHLSDGE